MDVMSFSSADLGALHWTGELPHKGQSVAQSSVMDHNRTSNLSPRENTTWDDAHDESVASLLLQEIDFLTLASPTANTDDHDYTSPSDQQLDPCSDISTTTSSSSTERQITDASGSPGDCCSWEDSLVTFSGDDASLCDGLSDDFDLLSYAEDGCNDCLLQQNEAAEDFGISDKSELDELLSCNDLLETESQFTQIKPRPRAVSQQCGQPDNSDSSSPTSGDPTAAVSLKKQPRRDADEPKRPKNGFIRYSIKHRAELLKKYPYKDNRTISKLLGIRWKKMTAEEKQPYVEEFNNDIHEIRSQNPKWRYAPAKRSAEELIDPMNKRLRPREKIRSKLLKRLDSEWDWDFSPDDSSHGSWDGRQSPLQKSANTWRQCDACSQWRPLSGHIDAEDLPQTWCCDMNPDSRFNRCATPAGPSLQLPNQTPELPVPASQCVQASHHSPVLLLLPPLSTSHLTRAVIVNTTATLQL